MLSSRSLARGSGAEITMKLRIKGNSLRLRVARSEVEKLLTVGRIEETTWFGRDAASHQTYALEHRPDTPEVSVRFAPPEIAIVIPSAMALHWKTSDEVGIYASIDLGPRGQLDLSIEKDFACLDRSDEDNRDTFPNPRAGVVC
jgi:hypothetical protein